MKITQIVEQRSSRQGERAAYARPVLREFGLVGALTQSGTGTKVEGASMMGAVCQSRFDRQMC